MKGFIVYPTYLNIDDQTYIHLFGRLENGQSFVTINKLNPYFFLEQSNVKKIPKQFSKCKISKTNLKTFKGKNVVKIHAKNRPAVNKISHALHEENIDTFESDIKPQYRFMIDNDLLGTIEIEGEYETAEKLDRVYKEAKITPAEFKPKLKIASIDIENDGKTKKLFCIGIYSDNYKKTFMITNKGSENIVACKDEADCLEKFKKALIELDPDIITGWNLIDYDLNYLKELFNKNKIQFDLGRTNSNVKLRIESSFFRASSADIPGRQVLDGLSLLKDPFIKEAPSIKHTEFESFTLENVSQAILNTGKLLKQKDRHLEISRLYKTNQQKLADYNLLDCELAYKILEKTAIIDLAIERSQLTGMPLDRITASIASFDSLYIREARKKQLVSPSIRFSQKEERIKGGYVMEANPGIYNNVLVLDFKSLYPSIIRTFNIDPSSFLEKKQANSIESPNKAYFKNQEGILPDIIEKLGKAREKAKKEERELSSYAIKVIMNSFFGVLASPTCRYFNLDIANAITHFGQFLIKLTAKEIEKLGYKVMYSDTDSVFIETNLSKTKANALGVEIQEKINKFYQEYTEKNYNRKSFLVLEFEKQYLSLLIPEIRSGTGTAAKKRYAGLIEKNGKEQLQITGLESVRGDWTEAAKDFQIELLLKIFHKQPIKQFVREYIQKIKSGKSNEKLIYKKSIRKPLHEYVKTTPPHVKAARKLPKLDSKIIKYYITTDGPEPIQKLTHKIDYEHYIKKQIQPIATQILSLINQDFEEIINKSKQEKLF